ncbi:histidine phosphatase family protein [Paenibacillus sp. CF384]|uniref:histidine phosphatase family protein n=1 Tax=Paenibacillus sp. CF384 TaxID=1884382 RepID=UPI000894800F|nr:histidine phosphatase family protein [Paenibacillus sp. CF384]SDX04589.1 probable phosphoglycerate mutase [Paenibacillus sp. CF384]
MSTTFYLVRHAKKEKGIGDVSITLEGLSEAQKTASHLRNVQLSQIVCSPLNRAKQTARIIAESINKTIAEDSRLRERANWGDLPGQTFQEFVAMWDRCTKEREFTPQVGDSARSAGERLASCLQELSVQYPHESIVIVTHGGLITDFMVNVCSEIELTEWNSNFVSEQSNLVAECSITKVIYRNGAVELVDFANTAHLYD